MRKIIIAILLLVLLFLDFTALDDIASGNESDYLSEYLTLVVSAVIFVGLGVIIYRNRKKVGLDR